MIDMQADRAAIQQVMRTCNDFVITGHTNPDGDTIGACYALGMALSRMRKNVRVVLEPYHEKFTVTNSYNIFD